MSDMERHVGKLQRIKFSKELSFKTRLGMLEEMGHEFEDIDLEWQYAYSDTIHYHKATDEFYLIVDAEINDDEEMSYSVEPNGDINYTLNFYNGGGSFSDMLGYVLDAKKGAGGKE